MNYCHFQQMALNLGDIMLSEITQPEKEKHYVISLLCGKQKVIQMNLYTKQKQTHFPLRLPKGKGRWSGKINSDCRIY